MNNTVKLFNLRLSGEFHEAIKTCADNTNTSIHQFIIDAVMAKLKEVKK